MTMHPAMPTSNSMQNSISRQRTHATHLLDRRTRSIIATPVADTSVIPSKLGKAPASAVSVESECYNSNIRVASVSTYGKKSEPGGRRGGVGGSEALKMDAWAVSESVLAFCCCIGCGFLCFSRFSMSLALAVKYSSSVLNCNFTGGNCEKFCGFLEMKFTTYLKSVLRKY